MVVRLKSATSMMARSYDFKNSHVDMADTCIECHDPHTGEVLVETCQICHGEQVKSAADLPKIREFTSAKDYDGDGKTDEPILGEITGLQESLLKSIQAYAKEVAGAEIKYDPDVYPYFSGADGKAYTNWTPRLLKAAYNYQFSIKDTGQYAHGPKYVIQLLYNSIEDLNAAEGLKTKTDLSKMNRVDYGHFDGTSMAFRDWDADGEVPASCAKCHSAGGLPQIFANPGATISTSCDQQSPVLPGAADLQWSDVRHLPRRGSRIPGALLLCLGEIPERQVCLVCQRRRQPVLELPPGSPIQEHG